MREVLFRGKRIDNGEWVEGYYVKAKHIISEKEMHIIFPLDLDLFPRSEFSSYEEVDRDTVCQYTGLKDANGKLIFEGDIVNQWDWNAVVEYGMFNCSCCDGVYGWYFNDADIRSATSCTVIGNIHDNPELLKEADHA